MKNKNVKFNPEKPYIIICEGADEYFFLIEYLNYLENTEALFKDCHYVIDFGGIDDVNNGIEDIKIYPHYEDMKGFLIIRDAETKVNSAVESLQYRIKETWGIEIKETGEIKTDKDNVKVGFFLLPGKNEQGRFRNGTLEDLCWDILLDSKESVSLEKLLNSVDDYITKIEKIREEDMKRRHKNKLHLYFSSTDLFVGSKIGEAAKYGAFDFSNEKMTDLKKMILQMQD